MLVLDLFGGVLILAGILYALRLGMSCVNLKVLKGLVSRKMLDLNKALIAKWSWNLLVGSKSLCLDILRARYLYSNSFFDIAPKFGDSPFWKAILSGRDIIREGTCLIVGDGSSVDPWKDPWVPNIPNFKPHFISDQNSTNARVKDFILQPGLWDVAKLRTHFSPTDPELISRIIIPIRPKPDRLIWTPMANGRFTMRSAYLSANKARLNAPSTIQKET